MTQPETETSTQTENREAEADLLRLCELTVECPCLEKVGVNWNCSNCTPHEHNKDGKCDYCQGTGQVAKYKMLRQECPCIEWIHNRESSWIKCLPCSDCEDAHLDHSKSTCSTYCQGRRWLPFSREKAGTEIRKMPEFLLLEKELEEIYIARFWTGTSDFVEVEALDADNATIAAFKKMEEAK